jgi:hypothetical protein
VKRRKFNERQQQARLTTRILTNSRVFRHARALVIYKELFRGLIATPFGSANRHCEFAEGAGPRGRPTATLSANLAGPGHFRTRSMRRSNTWLYGTDPQEW